MAARKFDRSTAAELPAGFSDWYYSEEGGLLLTTPARELCFTLQELLKSVERCEHWTGERVAEPRAVFLELLAERKLAKARKFLDDLDGHYLQNWPEGVVTGIKEWRSDIRRIPEFWPKLSGAQHFSVVQQVTSVLRSELSADVESRLR